LPSTNSKYTPRPLLPRRGVVLNPMKRLYPRNLWEPPAGPGHGPLPEILLMLTIVTGLVDAVSILALRRVFVANMTGNVVFAGFAIVGAPGFSLGASLLALGGFLVGAAADGAVARRVGHDRALHLRAAAGAELALLVLALIIAVASGDPAARHGVLGIGTRGVPFGGGITYAVAGVLAVAMGMQLSAARKLGVPDLTTSVVTATLTGIGADSRAGRRGHLTLIRRVLAVLTVLVGAMAGAWLVLNVSAVVPLAVAAGLVAITAGWAVLAARHPADWRSSGSATPAAARPDSTKPASES
jgi:uncharacterized membrane protein YoaK (UPF0700 family)